MKLIHRVNLLCAAAAAGVGMAVCIAMSVEPHAVAVRSTDSEIVARASIPTVDASLPSAADRDASEPEPRERGRALSSPSKSSPSSIPMQESVALAPTKQSPPAKVLSNVPSNSIAQSQQPLPRRAAQAEPTAPRADNPQGDARPTSAPPAPRNARPSLFQRLARSPSQGKAEPSPTPPDPPRLARETSPPLPRAEAPLAPRTLASPSSRHADSQPAPRSLEPEASRSRDSAEEPAPLPPEIASLPPGRELAPPAEPPAQSVAEPIQREPAPPIEQPAPPPEQPVYVMATRAYRPHSIAPAQLQEMIRPLLSEGVGMVTISSTAAAADGPQAEQTATSGAVLVRDRVEVLEQIDQAVAQVDVAPRQISIQALVLAVRLNEKHEDGVDFDLLEQSGDVQPIGLPIDGADPLSAFLVQGSRLRCAVVEGTVAQLLDTLDAVGPTSAAATRRHVIAENQSATIDLADTSGLPLGARALKKPADPPLSSSIDRLEILPIASADGSVRLEIRGLAPQGSEGLSAAKRTVPTTTVVLPDATAVLVGGVVRHLADSDAERGSRPSLRRRAKPDLESFRGYETLVLLNVHLVTPTGREAPVAIVPADREARRPIAERYRVCAEAAAREGDSDRAANLVDLALRFDALDAEARTLRNRLWTTASEKNHAPDSEIPRTAARSPENPLREDRAPPRRR